MDRPSGAHTAEICAAALLTGLVARLRRLMGGAPAFSPCPFGAQGKAPSLEQPSGGHSRTASGLSWVRPLPTRERSPSIPASAIPCHVHDGRDDVPLLAGDRAIL